jgi:uncharacterized protein YndB with AHSA1/START domain
MTDSSKKRNASTDRDAPGDAPASEDRRHVTVRTEVRRFERRLAHRPEKVWRALTEESELAHWFPATVEGERKKGAPLRFAFHDGEERQAEGTVVECDPPRVLVYTMGDETLRWELHPIPEGCVLVFTTEVKTRLRAANDDGKTTACAVRLAA